MNSITAGIGVWAALAKFPAIARQVEFAAEMERTQAAYASLGALSPEVKRMQKFIIALSGTTVASNEAVIRAAVQYNLRRMAMGEPFTPPDIVAWAKGFMRDSLAQLLQEAYRDMGYDLGSIALLDLSVIRPIMETYLADAQRLWDEVQVT